VQAISIFNRAGGDEGELAQIIAAINGPSMDGFGQYWNTRAQLTFDTPPGAWALWLLPGACPQSGDLAFHVSDGGIPVIQVYPETIAQFGESLCKAIDHEIKETLVDPSAAQLVSFPGGQIVKEVCDPVSSDRVDLGSGLDGSNFVLPSWFDSSALGPWDYLGNCQHAQACAPGGYKEELATGAPSWQLMAMRELGGELNWRLRAGHRGRLAWRAHVRGG
jgi:hypothetical protein